MVWETFIAKLIPDKPQLISQMNVAVVRPNEYLTTDDILEQGKFIHFGSCTTEEYSSIIRYSSTLLASYYSNGIWENGEAALP